MSFYGIYNKYLRNNDVPTERRNVAVSECEKSKIARYTKNRLFMLSNQRHPIHFVVEGHIYQLLEASTTCDMPNF